MRTLTLFLLVMIVMFFAATVASASQWPMTHPCAPAAAFTADSNYMSAEGKMRLDQFQANGVWTERQVDCYRTKPLYPAQGRQIGQDRFVVTRQELVSFTEETNYMSLEGYLRWLESKNPPTAA